MSNPTACSPKIVTPQSTRTGVLAAGQWILDRVKIIDVYPEEETLASILDESEGNGGCAYNLLKNLSLLGARFPLEGVGALGNDPAAERIRADALAHGVEMANLKSHPGLVTSYTDVMTVRNTGKRTFFHQRGANAVLAFEDVPLETSTAKLFHLGYLGLLDTLEKVDHEGRNGCCKLLKEAQRLGFVTSADMVSSGAANFPKIVGSCLPHLDYLLLNEFEAARLTGIEPVDPTNGVVRIESLANQAEKILGGGVQRAVVIHFAGGALYHAATGERRTQGAVCFPQERIAGAAGAGDAFAAGFLYGVHEEWSMARSLELAVCAAAVSLQSPTCSNAIRPIEECLHVGREYGFRPMS